MGKGTRAPGGTAVQVPEPTLEQLQVNLLGAQTKLAEYQRQLEAASAALIARQQQVSEGRDAIYQLERDIERSKARDARSQVLWGPPRNGLQVLPALLSDLPAAYADLSVRHLMMRSPRKRRLWLEESRYAIGKPLTLGDLAERWRSGDVRPLPMRYDDSATTTSVLFHQISYEVDEHGLPLPPYLAPGEGLQLLDLLAIIQARPDLGELPLVDSIAALHKVRSRTGVMQGQRLGDLPELMKSAALFEFGTTGRTTYMSRDLRLRLEDPLPTV